MHFIELTHFHGNDIQPAESCFNRSLPIQSLSLEYTQYFVIARYHAGNSLADILWVQVFKVGLDMRFQIQKLFVLIACQHLSIKLLNREYRALKHIWILEARIDQVLVGTNVACNNVKQKALPGSRASIQQ